GRDQLGHQPLGVMALGEPNRRSDLAELLVLLQEPRALEIPPFDAVEKIIEAGIRERSYLPDLRAQRLGQEQRVGSDRFGGDDQPAPHFRRDLIGGVAAEAAETEPDVMANQL